MKNLILYGAQNLSNKKMILSSGNNNRGNSQIIQKIDNARFAGSTVVDKKVGEKIISFAGSIRATESINFEGVLNEYSKAFNKPDRYLRTSTNYNVFTDLTDSTGWQVLGDTTFLEFDSEVFQYGDGSIRFNSDVSEDNNISGVYTLSGTKYNLASYGSDGNFEVWVYLPEIDNISGIELRVGNDESNYYSLVKLEQYDSTSLEVGWNYLSFQVADMNITGIIDPYDIGEYLYIGINYNDNATDTEEFRLGGILWQEDGRSKNYKSFVKDFIVSNEHYEITRANITLAFVAYKGISESTGSFNAYASVNNTEATIEDSLILRGTYTPVPVISIKVNSATNVSNISVSNTTTEDTISVARTYSAGDILIINMDDRDVKVSGSSADYDSVLPRFELGKNDIQISIESTASESVSKVIQDTNLTGEI